MAITWQNVGGPNFSGSNRLRANSIAQTQQGINTLSGVATDIGKQQDADTLSDFRHDLLNLGTDPEGSPKEFLNQALKLGKDRKIDPNELVAEVQGINTLLEAGSALDADQTAQHQGLVQGAQVANERGLKDIQDTMAKFDLSNRQADLTSSIQAYEAGYGQADAINNLRQQTPDPDDYNKITNQIFGVIEDKNYPDFVVSQALKETGLDVSEHWFADDGANVDTSQFKRSLEAWNDRLNVHTDNKKRRIDQESKLMSEHQANVLELQKSAQQYYKDTRGQNRRVSFGNK